MLFKQKMKASYILLLLFFFACKSNTDSNQESSPAEQVIEIPAEFVDFYEKFHTDSLFQVDHIIFPVKGSTSDQTYNKENWVMHKPFDSQGGNYERSFNNINGIIIEFVQEQSGFATIERRFSKISGEYQLIYYDIKTQFDNQ